MGKRWTVVLVVGALAVLGACGDSDDDGGTPEAAADSDELTLGDPCDLVPDDEVGDILGFDVTGELMNVGDGLPGATCMYAGAGGEGTAQLNVTPDGAGAFDMSVGSDLAEPGPDGLGDASYLVEAGEIGVRVGDHYIQVVVRGTGLTLEGHGAQIAERAVAAID